MVPIGFPGITSAENRGLCTSARRPSKRQRGRSMILTVSELARLLGISGALAYGLGQSASYRTTGSVGTFGKERGRGSYLKSCKSWAVVVQRPLLHGYRPGTVGLHGEEVYPVTGYHHPRTAARAKFVNRSICTLTPHSRRVGSP